VAVWLIVNVDVFVGYVRCLRRSFDSDIVYVYVDEFDAFLHRQKSCERYGPWPFFT